MSSKEEELYETSSEDEDTEITMLARYTKRLLFNVSNKWVWEEGIFEETNLGMNHQEITKLHVIVVNSLDI